MGRSRVEAQVTNVESGRLMEGAGLGGGGVIVRTVPVEFGGLGVRI